MHAHFNFCGVGIYKAFESASGVILITERCKSFESDEADLLDETLSNNFDVSILGARHHGRSDANVGHIQLPTHKSLDHSSPVL